MSKSKELRTTTNLVKQILTNDKRARNSDVYLYIKVCKNINPSALNLPFIHVMSNLNTYGLPPFETVRRTRQKLQEHNPELSSSSDVDAQKILNEEEYRDYARQVIV